MLSLSIIFMLQTCTPNQQLSFCRNELIDIADSIEFSVLENPGWEDLFVIDGVQVSTTLYKLADKLQRNLQDCPCIGTCTRFDKCDSDVQYFGYSSESP